MKTTYTREFEALLDALREQRYTGRVVAEIVVQDGGVRRINYFEKRVIDPHKRGT